MRRTLPATMAVLLALSAAPALTAAEDETAAPDEVTAEEAMAEEVAYERVEAPEVGLAMSFPAEWRVSLPEGTRESEIQSPEGVPVLVTTAMLANGGSGRWCDVDVYIDMIASLDEHAHAYVAYLQQVHGADAPMRMAELELPAGPAFQIDLFDPARERVRAMYLLDGPTSEDGTFDRHLLTCAAPPDSEPFWEVIAESIEVFESVPAEVPA